MDDVSSYTYEWKLPWGGDGATLTTRVFEGQDCVHLHFAHWFREYANNPRRPGEAPKLACETKLQLEYVSAKLASLKLTMNVIVPERLGKDYWAGMDISPGAKTFLEFVYEPVGTGPKTPPKWKLVEVWKGIQRHDLRTMAAGLMKSIDFPFPVPDEIVCDFGRYEVPYRDTPPESYPLPTFVFPYNIDKSPAGSMQIEEAFDEPA